MPSLDDISPTVFPGVPRALLIDQRRRGLKHVCGLFFYSSYALPVQYFSCTIILQLDSSAFFHNVAPGADNDVTGIVVLLAAAEVLGDLKRSVS